VGNHFCRTTISLRIYVDSALTRRIETHIQKGSMHIVEQEIDIHNQ